MPPGFKIIFPEGSSVPPEMDAFVPFRSSLASDPPDQSYLRVIGRLRDGATIPLAQQEIEMIAAHLRSKFTTFAEPPLNLQVVALQRDPVRTIRPALLALFGGPGSVLLIAAPTWPIACSRGPMNALAQSPCGLQSPPDA